MSLGVLMVDAAARITALNRKAGDLLELGAGDSLLGLLGTEVVGRFAADMDDMSMDVRHGDRRLHAELSAVTFKPQWQVLVCIRDVGCPGGPGLAHYRDMLASAADAMYIVKDGVFVAVNTKFSEMVGCGVDELVGRRYRLLLHGDSLATLDDALALSADGFIPSLEIRVRRKDGVDLWLEISAGQVVIDGDICHAGVIRDVTSRRKILDLRARFLNVASHEIRVPLTVIRGYARMLAKNPDGRLNADQMECVAEICSQSERLLDFSNSLLDFARIQAGHLSINRTRMNLGDHIAVIVRNLNVKAAEKTVRVIFDRKAEVPELMADPVRIEQALVNLIDNAIKHTPAGSEVRVVMEILQTSVGDIQSPSHQLNVAITVVDSGPGIRGSEALRIFDEFYTGDSGTKLEGAGLGLAITREIVHAHGGKVEAIASPKGGIFKITMPLNS